MTNSKIFYYFIIIVFAYFIYKKCNLKEKFKGIINYVDQHNYLKCCRQYGCRHFRCQRFLNRKVSQNRPVRIGYLKNELANGKNKILYLYKQKDFRNTNKYKYFYQQNFANKNYMLRELRTRTDLFDEDPIAINNKKYKVKMFDTNFVNHHYQNPNKLYRKRRKRIVVPQVVFKNYNYIGELNNLNIPGRFYMYGKLVDYHRNLFTYLILEKRGKKIVVVSKLNNHNKLNVGDYINVKIGPSLFTPFTII